MGATDYASAIAYKPHGAIKNLTLGNGLFESWAYNQRLQPTAIRLGTTAGGSQKLSLGLNYGTANNNGNLRRQTINNEQLSAAAAVSYLYDNANRLESVTEKVGTTKKWDRTYDYDVYGNRWMNAGSAHLFVQTPQQQSNFDAATNRLTTTFGASYDAAGNQTGYDNSSNLLDWTAAYDGENRQRYFCGQTAAACGSSNQTAEYRYDGEGRRVQKITGGVTTTYVYDALGRLAAEYSSQSPAGTGGTFFRTTDHLGSTRMVTRADQSIALCRDFFPFGEQIPASSIYSGRDQAACYGTSSSTFPQQFTGQERDDESDLDYFGARYYRPLLGRFTSPDAPLVDQFAENPQSWNLYGYVRNNPLSAIDPTGRETQICGLAEQETGEQACRVVNERFADAVRGNESFIVAGGDIYLRNEDGTQGQQIGRFEYLGPDGELSAGGQQVAEGLEARADASEQFITTLAAGAALAGAAPAAAGAAVRGATAVAGVVRQATVQTATGAGSAITQGKAFLFNRSQDPGGLGLLNGRLPRIGDYVRIGYGWKEAVQHDVFRISIGGPGKQVHWHLDLWKR